MMNEEKCAKHCVHEDSQMCKLTCCTTLCPYADYEKDECFDFEEVDNESVCVQE